MSDSNTLDLGALAPEPRKIKLADGREIQVQPPKMADTLRLSSLGKRLAEAESLGEEELNQLSTDLVGIIVKMVPGLQNEVMNFQQQIAVVTLLAEMSTPASTQELSENGITVSSNDPKDE